MSGGVGGIGGGGGGVPIIQPDDDSPAQVAQQAHNPDVFDPQPNFLKLQVDPEAAIQLVPGRLSLYEWTRIIGQLTQELKDQLYESEFVDAEKRWELFTSTAQQIAEATALYAAILDKVNAWNTILNVETITALYDDVVAKTDAFNDALQTVYETDNISWPSASTAISLFNDPQLLVGLVASFGGNQLAARDALLFVLQTYNDYVDLRTLTLNPALENALNQLVAAITAYNNQAEASNEALVVVNEELIAEGLEPLPSLMIMPSISGNLDDYYPLTLEKVLLDVPVQIPFGYSLANMGTYLGYLYTDPITPSDVGRWQQLGQAMLAQAASPEQQTWVVNAIQTAITGSFDSEAQAFLLVMNHYVSNFTDPQEGLDQFVAALGSVPAKMVAFPLPLNLQDRIFSYKRTMNAAAGIALANALQAHASPADQAKVTAAIGAAGALGPFVNTAHYYNTVFQQLKAQFPIVDEQEAINLFEAAILTIPLIPAITPPNAPVVAPSPPPLGEIPFVSYVDAVNGIIARERESILQVVFFLDFILNRSQEYDDEMKAFYRLFGLHILLPAPMAAGTSRGFTEGEHSIGGGPALSSFVMGLHSRALEVALSAGMLRGLAVLYQTPATGREFGDLQFTALELLSKSSLFSSLPAARFLASSLGTLGAASASVSIAIAEAIIIQTGALVSSGLVRNVVNSTFNRELRALGFQSIGGLASFTKAVAATLSLSILSVALAQLGGAIGMPQLVAQVFAQGSGVPVTELLVALTAGSQILDVLDNPASVLSLKQTLTDLLAYKRGISSIAVSKLIDSAVNNVILRGGITSFSFLQSELQSEFLKTGFSRFEANLLANETAALIRGEIGVQHLNMTHGIHVDPSIIAASIANNIYGIDRGVASQMLSSAVIRSLLHGGFGSRVRLQNDLRERFQELGLSRNDASEVAEQASQYLETIGVLVPLGRYENIGAVILGDPVMQAIAFGTGINRKEFIEDLESRGLTNTQAELIADQATSLAARNFTAPGNLLDLSLEQAIDRANSDPNVQSVRDFRSGVYRELKSAGFSRHDAAFLANSAAVHSYNGSLLSPFGISAPRKALLSEALGNRLQEELGISSEQAQSIVSTAWDAASGVGPFSNEDQLRVALKEELHKLAGGESAHAVDQAFADLTDANEMLGLDALSKTLATKITAVLTPDIGERKAASLKDQILTTVLGASSVDLIAKEENINPLSVTNQIKTQVSRLVDHLNDEQKKKVYRNLQRLIESLTKPNAQVSYLLQSLMDHPSTFIGSLLVEKPKGQILDIPA